MAVDPHLDVRFRHKLGTLTLNVAFASRAPWTVLFGPSGSGKSTILRAIVGLLNPDEGRIVLGGQVVFDSAAKVCVPPHQRPMRWAAQRTMLFPRMTVAENLSFARAEPADAFLLPAILQKYPQELSGGQQQRVSVARAASGARGKLLLLDEPFAGLDAAVRDGLIANLRDWLGDTPVVSVTHDVGEAFLLGAEVVRVAEGRIMAQGPVAEVLGEERRRLLGVLG